MAGQTFTFWTVSLTQQSVASRVRLNTTREETKHAIVKAIHSRGRCRVVGRKRGCSRLAAAEDRHFAIAHRGFRRPRQGRAAWLRTVGRRGQQGGRYSRTTSGDQDRQRRIESGSGRDQLPEPHHPGQSRHRFWTLLELVDDPLGTRCKTLRLRLHRAGRRRTEGLRPAPGQSLLRATGPGGEGRRRVRQVHPVFAAGPAPEDRGLRETRRPVRCADCRLRQGPVRGGRDQDGLRSDLSRRVG